MQSAEMLSTVFFFFFFFEILFIYLRERERENERGRSRLPVELGARCGTQSWDSRIMT